MRTVRNTKLALMLVVVMLATFVVGIPVASAAGTIDALSAPSVIDDPATAQQLGAVKVVVPAGTIRNGDSVIFKISGGFDFMPPAGFSIAAGSIAYNETTDPGNGNRVVVPTTVNAAGDANAFLANQINVTVLDANDEIQLTANADQALSEDFIFYVYFDAIEVAEGTSDDCVVTFDAPVNSGFPTGSAIIGQSTTSGEVSLIFSGADTDNNNFDFDLRVKEDTAGSLELENETLKFTLPDGYTWTTGTATDALLNALWGDDIFYDINVNDDELTIDFKGIDANGNGALNLPVEAVDTTTASAWDFTGIFDYTVDDEGAVEAGEDVMLDLAGETALNDSDDVVVGTYGDYGIEVSAASVPTLVAGLDEQEIGDIVITESLGGSVIAGRTVNLTLPEGARWQDVYDNETTGTAIAGLGNFDADEGLAVNWISYTGSGDRTAKFNVATASGDAAEIDLEDVEVAIEAGFEGDLVVAVSGSAGVSGEVVVANVVAPVEITADSKPDVVIGRSGQVAANITITEKAAGTLNEAPLVIDLPGGVVFAGTPTIEVISGDLKIADIQNNDNNITFDIDRDSDEASTIEVSNIKLKLDRTVAEGDITLKVQGNAAVETDALTDWVDSDTAAKVAVATCATPAPGETNQNAAFAIGNSEYTVNGVTQTMDVAPYIKDGRTYLPLRYVAQALGVAEQNILWDDALKAATLIKGDKVVQVKIGDNAMLINGISITMDVAPEITDGRTMLPFRFIGQAFGADFTWDDATKTVNMEL